MIFRLVVLFICLLFFSNTSFADGLLVIAEPLGYADYYVISIDGKEEEIEPSIDMIFTYDLSELEEGRHKVTLTPYSIDEGEGSSICFFLSKKTSKKKISYSIKKDKTQLEDDPYYNDRFDKPLKVNVILSKVSDRTDKKKKKKKKK